MLRLILRYQLILVIALGLLCAGLLLNEHLIPAGDNSTYLVLGQALATGRGYRMISDPRAPEMGLYPPGFPLLLAGVLRITGTARDLLAGILPCKLLSVLLYLATIALTYELLRTRSRLLALPTALLTALNPSVLHFATEVGTEIPYLVLSLACLLALDRYVRRPGRGPLVWTALLIVAAFYVRSIALVLAGALALYLILRRRLGHALVLLIIVGATAAPWFIRGQSLPDTGTSVGLGRGYFDLYFSNDPYGLAPASLGDWTARVAGNVQSYVLDIWPNTLFPHAARLRQTLGAVGTGLAILITFLLALGFVLELRNRHPSEWYVAAFFASCVTYLWAQSRLIVPIIPLAIYYFLVAVHFVLEELAHKMARPPARQRVIFSALVVGCALLALSAMVVEVRRAQRNLLFGLGQRLAVYYSEDPEWVNYLQAMEWIAYKGEAQSVVICRKADLIYIVTGHRALEYPYSQNGMELKRSVDDNGVAYVIEDAFSWTGTTDLYLQPSLLAWQSAEPAALSLAFETDAPRTRVWRVVRPGE